jgi:hypothetical protein
MEISMPELRAEKEMAYAMLGMFGADAARRASDNAYLESLICADEKAAYWRRVTAMIVGFQLHSPQVIVASA